ncbi:MAG TPA: carboxypeptidase-like regulatory domain-containing protein, partial [Niastella sp.]|nr:carboxypeptidase-like regulatory domain-containing protein [Niastella sp.]
NETGNGMAEVTVVLKGTSVGTITNEDGSFSINASKGSVLVFSYVDYDSKEIAVGDAALVSVQLSAASQLLDEVAITALGITKQKRSLGYSTTDVEGSKLTQARETNIGNALTVVAQQKITGKVVNETGNGMAEVTVVLKGTTVGTITNQQGIFSIHASRGNVLVISYVDYDSKEVVVGDAALANIQLSASSRLLGEVTITALGITKQKRSLGYSTTEVDGSKLTQARESNIGNALTGQVAGVNVAGISTGPYGSSRVMIRGNASLKSNNQPIYVVDGIPFDNTNQGFAGMWGGADYGDGLSTINPDDIESVQVLKGVAASALYGYRGGNGAILITTKSGLRNKGASIEVNNNITFNSVIDYRRELQYTYGQGFNGTKPQSDDEASSTAFDSWGAKLDGSPVINFIGDSVPYKAYKNNLKNFL